MNSETDNSGMDNTRSFAMLAEGSIVSHYKIIEKIGAGGMGEVYLAEDTELDRQVALKFLSPHLCQDEDCRARFKREAQATATLKHPNIVTIYEVSEYQGSPYFAMEHIEGQSLRDIIKDRKLSIDKVIDLAIQICEGLSKAHQAGITHRDIKPSNIVIDVDGRPKLLDFGLAAVKGAEQLTQVGTTMGTAGYMSPEQARGDPVDHRTDIWSMGVVLYEMLTGKLPFKGDSEQAVIYSILNVEPELLRNLRKDIPAELEKIILRALSKDRESRYSSISELLSELTEYRTTLIPPVSVWGDAKQILKRIKQPKIAIPGALFILLVGFFSIQQITHSKKVRWAREYAIPQIGQYVEVENYTPAFRLASEAEKYIPSDPALMKLWEQLSWYININSEPEGVIVQWKDYEATDADWEYIGQTPLDSVSIPLGFLRLKLEKKGFRTVYATHFWWERDLFIRLDEQGTIAEDMVRVPIPEGGIPVNLIGYENPEAVQSHDYLIDMYEVTNSDFKQFIDRGGYEKRQYWKIPLVKDGRTLSWEEAMAEFKDKTGRTGPATWETGNYPEGQDDYPVTGVSWYEAAAFAEFAGKSLPTIYHWDWATHTFWGRSYVISRSNFGDRGPAPVGSYDGLCGFGVYDMAGNVREWCWNEYGDQRYILGGGWNDQPYSFNGGYTLAPFDRSPTNGFRCIKHSETDENLSILQSPIEVTVPDFAKEKPVSDEIFKIYASMYAYDRTELSAVIESIDSSAEQWTVERISFDAAYGNERVIAYLFLPRTGKSPYQTIVYFPGIFAALNRSMQSFWFSNFDFIIKSGRALMFPIYKGTYERGGGIPVKQGKSFYKEGVMQCAKDLGRSVDYLATRADVDTSKLAYYGLSWGARLGTIMCAIETRFKASVLYAGGLGGFERLPEVNEINFVSHIEIPILMINGRYDNIFPYETNQIPMFQLIGTPLEHKRHAVYEAGHMVPRTQLIRETLDWLDRYLGSVK